MTRPFNFRNVLVLLGIIITSMALIYFAFEFQDVISDWGRVIDFLLLGIIFAALGIHFEQSSEPMELVARGGWRWLKVTNALYILAAVNAFATVIAFFAVEDLSRVIKVFTTLAVGVALILVAAQRLGHRE